MPHALDDCDSNDHRHLQMKPRCYSYLEWNDMIRLPIVIMLPAAFNDKTK